jgi:SAM-dependent methyltransferase
LEIGAITRWLGDGRRVLDLGCGNGYTLLSIGREVAGRELIGVDFSEKLVDGAATLIEQALSELKSVPQVFCRDAWACLADTSDASVDCMITERFLLNLPNWESQKGMLREIERVLAPGGRLLMCESSQDGFRRLNDLREACGLAIIPETSADNLSSNRFVDEEIETFVTEELGLRLCAKEGASEYFLISRVLHPLLVAPTKPRFDSKINELARRIQFALPFQPGFGSNVLWVLEKPDQGTSD